MRNRSMHPIITRLRKVPLPLPITIFLVSVTTYLLFIGIAFLAGQFLTIMLTFMHTMQVIFSVTIFVGLVCLEAFYRVFDTKMREMRGVFPVEDDAFEEFLERIFTQMNSSKSLLAGIPFVLLSVFTVYFFVMPTMPANPLFPVNPYSLLWIYFAFGEFSVFMLLLLGQGVWIGFVALRTARTIGKTVEIEIRPVSPDRAGGLVPFSEAILRGVIMYSIIVALIFPFLAYLANYILQFNPLVVYLPISGLGLVLATIIIFFLAPQYHIHKVIEKQKWAQLKSLSDDVNAIIRDIRGVLKPSKTSSQLPPQRIMLISLQLTELYNLVERMKTWPADFSLLLKAFGSLALVIVAFFTEQTILYLLQTFWSAVP